MIRYPEAESDLSILIGLVCLIVFLIFLVALAVGFYLRQIRKFKKERDALILERLILLQKRKVYKTSAHVFLIGT